ncbi:MAG: ketoacyl-ACP synthase III [Proteobacteria bacterium]|nr:ketoacyl-ACP synthase III [Pseudomonadota bacterium]
MDWQYNIISTGAALPKQCVSNAQLIAAKGLDSHPDWIESRTGITQRYLASEGETTFTLARDAAQQALATAKLKPADIGHIIVATCTPDLTFPSVAALIHGALGMGPQCSVLDVNAACSGFIQALAVAQGLLATSEAEYAVVVGAETFSNLLDWSDRGTCVLFGDGAGAVILHKQKIAKGSKKSGILATSQGASGEHAALLHSAHGVARGRTSGTVQMNGREVFKHAVRQMGEVPPMLASHGVQLADIDWLIPHQANLRIIEAAAQNLGLPMQKVVATVAQHANTSAASIPLALHTAVTDGRIQRGNTLLLQAFGAGFAYSSALIKW